MGRPDGRLRSVGLVMLVAVSLVLVALGVSAVDARAGAVPEVAVSAVPSWSAQTVPEPGTDNALLHVYCFSAGSCIASGTSLIAPPPGGHSTSNPY